MAKKPAGRSLWLTRLEPIRTVAAIIAVLVAFGSVLFWGYNLQNRVSQLETQVRVMLTASSGQNAGNQPGNSAACANLIQRRADAMAGNDRFSVEAANKIKELMIEVGCIPKQ